MSALLYRRQDRVPGIAPVYTYRNLDLTEDLRPGVTDVLTFAVGNLTAAVATINLVVDNTCPGWSAVATPAQLINMAPGEVRVDRWIYCTVLGAPVDLSAYCEAVITQLGR